MLDYQGRDLLFCNLYHFVPDPDVDPLDRFSATFRSPTKNSFSTDDKIHPMDCVFCQCRTDDTNNKSMDSGNIQ